MAKILHMKGGWVYIMTNRPNGTLYVGVTNDIVRRTYEHRTGAIIGFIKRYGLHVLVYFECHEEIQMAIQWEKNIKEWPRAWHVNPEWRDLYSDLL